MGRKGKKQFVIQGRLLMWMMVMFDLPTKVKKNEKQLMILEQCC